MTDYMAPFLPAPNSYDHSYYWYMYNSPSSNSNHHHHHHNNSGVILPRANDVILGRGGKKHEHSGNVRLQKMALDLVCEYIKARKKEKGQIAEQLVEQVHQYGGRFMEQKGDNGPWEVVTFEKARAKARDVLHSIEVDPKKLLRDRLRTFSCGDGNPFAGMDDLAGTWTQDDEAMGTGDVPPAATRGHAAPANGSFHHNHPPPAPQHNHHHFDNTVMLAGNDLDWLEGEDDGMDMDQVMETVLE